MIDPSLAHQSILDPFLKQIREQLGPCPAAMKEKIQPPRMVF
jgi:hypothetical protein